MEEHIVLQHFKANHSRKPDGQFIVPLLKSDQQPLGESRFQAVRRFLSLENALNKNGKFSEFKAVIEEYFYLRHAEVVPFEDLEKHILLAVYKNSSTTTKV